jgi:hypothetical protein
MAGSTSIKNFKGGMNKDLDFSLLKEDQYYDALNYKLVADEDANGFVLENAEGNSIWLELGVTLGVTTLDDTYFLVGHCYVQPYLVLFYTTNHVDRSPDASDTSVIVRCTVDKDELQQASIIYTDGVDGTKLDLSDTYPISAVGYYETPDNIKVYWTDYYNSVRGINIMDESLATYTAGMLDLTPDFPLDISTPVNPRPQIIGLVDGALPVCSIQYTYQYFIKNGGQTLWAPSSPIQVIPIDNNIFYLEEYIGGEKDDQTGYGVNFNIDVPADNRYNSVRVVAIQYNSLNAVPIIRVFKELDIQINTALTLNIIDIGSTINELSYEEFAVVNTAIYKAKTLAVKDNRLFLGNVEEDFFDVDFDARAYRHNIVGSGAYAKIYDSDLSTNSNVKNAGGYDYTFATVPEDHDCINRYNDIDQEATLEYIYCADGATLGAEGANVKLEFTTDDIVLDTLGANTTAGTTNNILVSGTSTELYGAGVRSFHRQEVYRVGILFRNSKMQPSPIKWSCDLKTPNYIDDTSAYSIVDVTGSTTSARNLGIKCTLSNMPSDAVSWELVYVPRSEGDRSVLGQGIIQPHYQRTGEFYYMPTGTMYPEDISAITNVDYDPVVYFESPEISYNKNLEYATGDFYQKVGTFNFVAASELNEDATYRSIHYKVYDLSPEGDYSASYKHDIDKSLVLQYDTNIEARYTLDAESVTSYSNITYDGPQATQLVSEQGTFPTAFLDSTATGETDEVVLANYKRNVFSGQYGGIDYYSRQYNDYIGASDLSFSNTNVTTYEGDTVIDFYHHCKQYIDVPNALSGAVNTRQYTHLFPIETSILVRLSHSPYMYRYPTSEKHRLVQEISGTWEGDIPFGGTTWVYTQEQPLYEYNSVYSQSNKASQFVADNDSFEILTSYPVRIINSEVKTNNETLDSFTQFKPNNFIDLDGDKGPIHNLKTFKSRLFFWQNSGFGIASVNTRSLIQDNNPGILAVGTGGVLDRYDYISDDIGNQSQFGITNSRTALYWGDANKNELFKYDNSLKSESKLKGIQTWINEKGRIGEIKTVFDHKYNDVIFTLTFTRLFTAKFISGALAYGFELSDETGLNTSLDYNLIINGRYESTEINPSRNTMSYFAPYWYVLPKPYGAVDNEFYATIDQDPIYTYTVTFNEIADKWVSRNSFTPGRYIEIDTNFLSTNDYHDLYKHNDENASRCNYYTTEYDSELTVVFNKEYPYTKVWDTLKWDSESINGSNINQFKDTFDKVTIYNDYQHTGDRDLYFIGDSAPATRPTEIGRRERTWSMAIPRNIVDENVSDNKDITDPTNWDETQSFKERIRSKYMVVNFVYDNASGNTFSIPFISALYRKSIR